MKYKTVQQVADMANMSKSGMWHKIKRQHNFKQYESTDSKTRAILISPKGVRILLLNNDTKKKHVIHVSSSMYNEMILNNQRQAVEIYKLTKLLQHQQQIAENAQNEARQLKINPPKHHGIIWKLFHNKK